MMEAAGQFTQKLWITVQPVYKQILNCSYVKRLADGTLPHNWFAHYISQDALYLTDDSRALAVTAARASDTEEMYFLLQLAKDGLDIERTLQNDFIKQFRIPKAREKSPAFKAYATFLMEHAFHSPFPVAVAALLPCFWVYCNTGETILNNTVLNNPYQKWIETYSDTRYKEYTRRFIQLTEKNGQNAESGIGKQMIKAFEEGTKHELRVLKEATSH